MNKAGIMSVLLGGFLMVAGGLSVADAYGGKGAKGYSVDERVERMTKNLDLSAEQKASVKTILDQHQTEKDALKAQMKALHEGKTEKINAVLNDEQKTKHEAMRKEQGDQYKKNDGKKTGDKKERKKR